MRDDIDEALRAARQNGARVHPRVMAIKGTTLEYPRNAERDYIAAIGIAAVFVATIEGVVVVRASRDLEASARTLRAHLVAAWWVKDRDVAEEIARGVNKLLPKGGADVERARAYIAAAAASSGLKLTEHATVMKRVAVAARRVEDALRVANGRGELAWFNRAYRDYRLRGGRSMSYGEARARLRRAMLRRLVLVEGLEYGPDMLAEVFGKAISTAK